MEDHPSPISNSTEPEDYDEVQSINEAVPTDGYKELLQLEFPNGSKIILGSSQMSIEQLCVLATELKPLLNHTTKQNTGGYLG